MSQLTLRGVNHEEDPFAGAVLCNSSVACLAGAAEQAVDHPTYANEVSRIIQDNCQICHQPGQIGPMSFTSYEEVRPWAPLIRMKVAEREMPPYQYDADIGIQELKNDWRLSQDEIDTIVAWVDAGSPLGNPEDLPPPKEFPPVGEWRLAAELGPPDHVIKSTAWDVPAAGQDLWWEPEVDSGITESRCIKAVETLPSRKQSVPLTMPILTSWCRTKMVNGYNQVVFRNLL